MKENIVEKSGAWFAYNNVKIGQGRENAKIYFQDNPAVCLEVENKVRIKYGLHEEGSIAPESAGSSATKESKRIKAEESKGETPKE